MTRINTIDVKDLTDQHLMAEYRELPMVMAALRRSLKTQSINFILAKIPSTYTLNKGHVTFFYDKGTFLSRRYNKLITELYLRGYNINPYDRDVSFGVHQDQPVLNQNWAPSSQDHIINIARIVERVGQRSGFYRVRGQLVNSDQYIDMLSKKYEVI